VALKQLKLLTRFLETKNKKSILKAKSHTIRYGYIFSHSKNIRPIIMIWILGLFTIMIGCIAIFGTEFPQVVMNSIFVMSGITLGFYFPGRTVEKWIRGKL